MAKTRLGRTHKGVDYVICPGCDYDIVIPKEYKTTSSLCPRCGADVPDLHEFVVGPPEKPEVEEQPETEAQPETDDDETTDVFTKDGVVKVNREGKVVAG